MIGDGLFIFIALVVAAILGYLLGRLLWKGRIQAAIEEWRTKYNARDGEYNSLDRRYRDLNKKVGDYESNASKLSLAADNSKKETEDWKIKFNRLKADFDSRSGIASEYDALRKKHGDLEERFKGNEATINDLLEANKQLEAERNAVQKNLQDKDKAIQQKGEQKSEALEAAKASNEKQVKDMEAQLQILRERNDKLNLDYNELNKSFDTLSGSKKKVDNELDDANKEIAELKRSLTAADNSADLAAMKAKLDTLQLKHDESERSFNALQLTNGDLLKKIALLEATPVKAGDDFEGKYNECQEEVAKLKSNLDEQAALKAKMEAAEAEIAKLKGELEAAKAKAAAPPPPPPAPVDEKAAKNLETLNRIRQKAANINFARIGTATADEKDDLKEIKGIGPFIEEKLNALGIYTFRQIANFDEDDDDKVNDAIEFFPGRIKRDEWKKQARELFEKKKNG